MSTTLKTTLQFVAGAALGFVVLAQLGTWHLPTVPGLASIGWQRALITLVTCILSVVFYKMTDRRAYERGRITGFNQGRAQAVADLASRSRQPQVLPTGLLNSLNNAVKSKN